MREEVIASQPNDWRNVVTGLLGRVPGNKPVYYQKHMTHHMIPAFGRGWLAQVRNAFLIRDPAAVLASYVAKRGEVTLADIGIVQQRELFEQEADRLGRAPPIVEGADILADPARVLARLCSALGIAYDDAMLHWAARAARQRWRMGARLVRRRRAFDRLRTAFSSRRGAAGQRIAADRRGGATALRGARQVQALVVRFEGLRSVRPSNPTDAEGAYKKKT